MVRWLLGRRGDRSAWRRAAAGLGADRSAGGGPSDLELVRLLHAGDREAVGAIYDRYRLATTGPMPDLFERLRERSMLQTRMQTGDR